MIHILTVRLADYHPSDLPRVVYGEYGLASHDPESAFAAVKDSAFVSMAAEVWVAEFPYGGLIPEVRDSGHRNLAKTITETLEQHVRWANNQTTYRLMVTNQLSLKLQAEQRYESYVSLRHNRGQAPR